MTDRIYARISLDTKVSGSIDKQIARLRKVAFEDVKIYQERSVSGSKIKFKDRPEGAKLLADLQRGDRVLVTKIDRAARNVRDLLDIVESIEAAGATVSFVDQAIDTAGPMGRFLLTLLGAIAELEAGIIAERRKESLEAFKADGRHAVGAAPFGLQSVQNPNGRGLVLRPHPTQADVLRKAVTGILNGDAQRTWAPVVGMGAPAFSRLLRNERLAGILGYDGTGPKRDEDMALFSLAEWKTLQDHLARPEKSWSKAEGIGAALTCSECGDRLYLNKSKKNPAYATYRCRGVAAEHKAGRPCSSIMAVNADAYVAEVFLETLGDTSIISEITLGSDEARNEAVALAELVFDAARVALDQADEDNDEVEVEVFRAAKKALREAKEMPSETVTKTVDLGVTYAESWAEATDDETRVTLLRDAGTWTVHPGRGPISEKVRLTTV